MQTCTTILSLAPLLCLAAVGYAQTGNVTRPPAVAGMFYPGQVDELKQLLDSLLAAAEPRRSDLGEPLAIIVPHAGYQFSGGVAASGINQIDPEREFDTIFLLGPSHRVGFEGAAVDLSESYRTPLGSVTVNRRLAEELAAASPLISVRPDAHSREHSLEVQLPFLQRHLKKPFRILPIVMGFNTPDTCRSIGLALKPYLTARNLFVISTDFSHYPAYDDAVRVDRAVAEAIVSNSADALVTAMQRHEDSEIANLATTLCGSSAVLTLMAMTADSPGIGYHAIQYRNSGDSPLADRHRVVGYYAISVSRKPEAAASLPPSFDLSPQERTQLLAIARRTVIDYVRHRSVPEIDAASLSRSLTTPCGAFVTLRMHGQLRGCIGQFEAAGPLYTVVQEMAVAAASRDYRFQPVTDKEIPELTFEISVLTPMRRITSSAEFELGRHGIYMRRGTQSGTFLPQVAHETRWSAEEFLGHCARDKAGIGWEGWKDKGTELYVYEALVFGETP